MSALRWRNIRYATPMPANFYGVGIQSANGRFFVGMRFGGEYNHLNWGFIDWNTGTVKDGFSRRKDAKAYVEMECL